MQLFILAKIWKQPKCPSIEKWTKKMWYIYILKYYSVIKKNAIMPFAATWMDLEGLMLSKIRQILCDITYTWALKNTTN